MTLHESAGGVVIGPSKKIAIVSQHGRSWSLPKGGIDPGEDALTAAKREIWEETGISELDLVADLGHFERWARNADESLNMEKRKRIQIFLFKTGVSELAPLDPSNPEAIWLKLDAAIERISFPEDQEFLRAHRDQIASAIG